MPPSKTIKELRSFLGLLGFYRRFIKNYAKLAKPLVILLRGEEGHMSLKKESAKIPVILNDRTLKAVTKIKNSLYSEEVMLVFPNKKNST